MSEVLFVKSSILGDWSQSGQLLNHAESLYHDKGVSVTVRDLVASPLPVLDGELVMGLRGGDSLSERQREALVLSDELIAEIQGHNTLVIAAPMYNFGVPVQLKSWIDLICRAGVTFRYTDTGPQGLIQGKNVILVTTRGGIHQGAATDHVVPYLKTVLNFIGINDIDVVYAEALNMDGEQAKASMKQAANELEALINQAD
ncbi:FMN-dependent NADH-azoreductase [Shewanella sp. GXUN23E]|uniref:FMN-dependent NADH-azoreductase n=1 Tax=Shewanella sp. GXUN23E TaxID=3422498 RepID=UPI003D7C5942